ncbi:hypothetical protein BSKO_09678 [Bryopsis sp. KO-2023]|nr:hypothetical protein BSKO_09678 [Bryopsis sp. KO-2023]
MWKWIRKLCCCGVEESAEVEQNQAKNYEIVEVELTVAEESYPSYIFSDVSISSLSCDAPPTPHTTPAFPWIEDEAIAAEMMDNGRNELLDAIQKEFAAYLEKKRLYFPLFCFLASDEMLEILSETENPTRVQPHVKKCFEGVAELHFKKNVIITSIKSVKQEQVPFEHLVDTVENRGSVEKWLLEVEAAMFESVHNTTALGIKNSAAKHRNDWVLEGSGMVILVVTALHWTQGVAIQERCVKQYGEFCTQDLVKNIDSVLGKLTELQRATLGALVVMNVHTRDVVTTLAATGVDKIAHFECQAQLRSYWDKDESGEKQFAMLMRMMSATLEYGYEDLGNSSRLVITPQTDRYYRTLLGAIHLTLEEAPEWPAGTGKTETTKDLAKSFARQCVLFNWADSLDYIAMGKFFKVLASSGAWECFDEFNLIDLEALSVVAQQVPDIQREIAARLTIEGKEIQLKWSARCATTMNPGYDGRYDLPDNLKALLRMAAMMALDYAMILGIRLFSLGYHQARECAQKIIQCCKLCSEQLASQDHYDYGNSSSSVLVHFVHVHPTTLPPTKNLVYLGMKAVMASLRAEANLKQSFSSEDAFVLLIRSIADVNLGKFSSHDVPLFQGNMSDLVPGVVLLNADYVSMETGLGDAYNEMKLQAEQCSILKELSPPIFAATLEVYFTAMSQLLPTPTKSNCTFYLGDISRVGNGLLMMKPLGKGDATKDLHFKLWNHEILRVFYERLVDEKYQQWFLSALKQTTATSLNADFDKLFKHVANEANIPDTESIRRCFFGNYKNQEAEEPSLRPFSEIIDIALLISKMDECLVDHKSTSKQAMNLAMFLYAVKHVSRVCRVLKQPGEELGALVYFLICFGVSETHFVAMEDVLCHRRAYALRRAWGYRKEKPFSPWSLYLCFQRWQTDALEAVAMKFLQEIKNMTKEERHVQIMDTCKMFPQDIVGLSDKFRSQAGRINYVTPTSYLELITTFKRKFAALLAQKGTEISAAKKRCEMGLEKLELTVKQVNIMQNEPTALKPTLAKMVSKTGQLMATVQKGKTVVSTSSPLAFWSPVTMAKPKRALVDEEVKKAEAAAVAAKAIKMECEEALAEEIPVSEGALQVAALDTIKPTDIKLVQSFRNPPCATKLVMEAVCVLLNVKPTRVNDPSRSGKKIDVCWEPSKRLLGDPQFVVKLQEYDKENVPPKIMERISKNYTSNPDFTPANAAKAFSAAKGQCKWACAMDDFDKLVKVVAPKKATLADAEGQYNEVMTALQAKEAKLKDKMETLEQQLDRSVKQKTRLEDEVEFCTKQLESATKWVASKSKEIPSSLSFSLRKGMGDPVISRAWGISGLPNDSLYNEIMVAYARRWSPTIDPHTQVRKQIKEKEAVAEQTQQEIAEAPTGHKPCGVYNAVLFLCIRDVAAEYSLAWFIGLFVRSIRGSEKSKDLLNINDHFTYFFYTSICLSLFENDKVLLAFLLNARYIDALPSDPIHEVFGLHENANITKDLQETDMMSTLLMNGGGGGE